MILSLYEQTAARAGECQIRNASGISSNEQVKLTERYFEDDGETFSKYDLKLLDGLEWKGTADIAENIKNIIFIFNKIFIFRYIKNIRT